MDKLKRPNWINKSNSLIEPFLHAKLNKLFAVATLGFLLMAACSPGKPITPIEATPIVRSAIFLNPEMKAAIDRWSDPRIAVQEIEEVPDHAAFFLNQTGVDLDPLALSQLMDSYDRFLGSGFSYEVKTDFGTVTAIPVKREERPSYIILAPPEVPMPEGCAPTACSTGRFDNIYLAFVRVDDTKANPDEEGGAETEIFQFMMQMGVSLDRTIFDKTPLTKEASKQKEVFANSVSYATRSARTGLSYAAYLNKVSGIYFLSPAGERANPVIIPQDVYEQLRTIPPLFK